MTDQSKGLLITFFGVLCVIPDSYFIRVIDASALTVFFWRSFLQGIVVGCVLFLLKGRGVIEEARQTGWAGVFYAVALGLSSLCFVLSIKYTNVANTVFIIATIPLFAALSSWVVLKETISKRLKFTMIFALIGVSIIAYGSTDAKSASSLLGDAFALGAALIFGCAITASRSIAPLTMTSIVPVGYFLIACLVMPFAAPFSIPEGQWIFVYLHGGVFLAVSSVLLALGPRYITAAEVGLLILLESAFAPLLVWVLLGETPTIFALLGGAILLITLIVSNAIIVLKSHFTK